MKLILIALFCSICPSAYGANILGLFPFPTFSHTNAYIPILKGLAKKGHNVTMVSPFPQKEPIPNYTDFILENTMKEIQRYFNSIIPHMGHTQDYIQTWWRESIMSFTHIDTDNIHTMRYKTFYIITLDISNSGPGMQNLRNLNFLMKLTGLWPMCNIFLDPIFKMPKFQEFMNDRDSKFDLVIIETFFCQQPMLAFAHKYGASVAAIVTVYISPGIAAVSGNPYPMAYVPNLFFPLSDHMSFLERVQNTFFSFTEILVDELYGFRLMNNVMKEQFKNYPGFENLPHMTELQNNISLFLVDNHVSLNYPRPYLPNVVEFGGLTVKVGEKLPDDLEKFMNESKDGVIFFTWGSHYKMINMEPELLSAFMSVFGKLKQRVLMKWENETLPGKPDNVKIAKWLPQASLLSHPNIRIFITHGGIHGTSEAIFNAVPLLGTPLFGDHFYNLKMVEESGMGLNVDIDTVTEKELSTVIDKLLHDPKYKENAIRRSKIFRDRPLNSLDNAVFWVEYVLRHNGAHHLRPAALDLAWYQNWLLDVIAFFAAVLIGIGAILFYSLKCICCLFKKKKKSNEKVVKKNKKD